MSGFSPEFGSCRKLTCDTSSRYLGAFRNGLQTLHKPGTYFFSFSAHYVLGLRQYCYPGDQFEMTVYTQDLVHT